MISKNIQLDEQGRLKHFLSIEGFKRQHLVNILDAAEPARVLLPLPAPAKKNGKLRVKEGKRFKTGELIVPGVYSTVTGIVEKVEPLFTMAGEFEALRIKVAEQEEFDAEIQAEPDFTAKTPIEILGKLNTANMGFREELETIKTVVVSAVDTDPLHTTLQQILRQEKLLLKIFFQTF